MSCSGTLDRLSIHALPLTGYTFYPERNYTIGPGPKIPTPVTTRKQFTFYGP